MRATVDAAITTEQVLIEHLAQAQPRQAAGEGSRNGTEYSTSAHSGRRTDLAADTRANQSTGSTRGGRAANGASHGADGSADALAVIGINHPPRSAAGTEFGHRGILMKRAS